MNRFSPRHLIILTPIILLSPVLFGGQAIYYGTASLQFLPWRALALDALRAGDLPLWNPLNGLGAPLIANYQSALFYPPNWLLLIMGQFGGDAALAWGQGVLVAFHLILAGWGMRRLAGRLGYGELAQVVGGLAFSLSGYLVARSHFLSINAAVAWLPWVMGGVYALASSYEFPRVPMTTQVLLGTHGNLLFPLTMLFLAGHAQTAWYTLLLAGAWAVYWGWGTAYSQINHTQGLEINPLEKTPEFPRVPPSSPEIRASTLSRLLLSLALISLLAAALAAIQLFPTAELLLQSQRSTGAAYDFAMTYSFWPWRFLGLLAPGLFGSPVTGDFWGYVNFWEDAVYIGLLPICLALAALFKRKSSTGNNQLLITNYLSLPAFLLGIALLSFALALGKNTPIFPFLYRYVPTFDLFQAPTRFTIWAVFALALLAAIGMERWQAESSPCARRRAGRWIAAALAILLAATAAKAFVPGIEPSFVRSAALAGGLGIISGALARFRVRGPLRPRVEPVETRRSGQARWEWSVALVVAADLLIAGWGLNPGIPLDFYRGAAPDQVQAMLGQGRLYLPDAAEYALTFDHYFRFDTFATDPGGLRAALLPNLNLLDGIPSANNFEPLLAARYARWIDALEGADAATRAWMLAEMGVTVLERLEVDAPARVRFDPVGGLPRLQWFPCARPANSPEAAWEQVMARDPAFGDFLTLENFPAEAERVCGAASGAAALIFETPNELRIQVTADTAGWLMVRDTFYPGWAATVNGARAEVHPANFLFRAVPVPAGESEVVMRYRPLSFYAGAGVSGMALAGLVILGVKYRKGKMGGIV